MFIFAKTINGMSVMTRKDIEIEVCAYSVESCRNALAAGADRVELCAGMWDGGVTPSEAREIDPRWNELKKILDNN